jgi:Skp family chaperone for outer membrane proteins
VFSALDRTNKSYDLDPTVAARRAELTLRKKELEAKEAAWNEHIAKSAGAEFAALEKEIAAAEKAASQGRQPEYGWHSGIERSAETAHELSEARE